MFPPVRVGGGDHVLRPANHPHHAQVHAARPRSHRDLPLRCAEPGSMVRDELSGTLVGLRRVRRITLDDAHSSCRPDQVVDAAGREDTLSTVQVDHVQPERFGSRCTGEDGREHRPVVVHRGLLGSLERLVAVRLERDGGRFPLWLVPVQLRRLPVSGERRVPRVAVVGDREVADGSPSVGDPARAVPAQRVHDRLRRAVRDREPGRVAFD